MTILITGGGGFIGVEIARQLLDSTDQRIVLLERTPNEARLSGLSGDVELVRADVGEFSHVLSAIESARPDIVFHMAAQLSAPSEDDPAGAIRANALGTFHVLEAARLFGVRRVLFPSSIGTYGTDVPGGVADDDTSQRPFLFYGATKVFGEHMGRFYRRRYGIDFRGVRYPAIVGPGVTTPGVAQYTSWMIEEAARGNPFTALVPPETAVPVLYVKDAARSLIELSRAPAEAINTVVYNLSGVVPVATAGELADLVRARIPGAKIEFKPDPRAAAAVENIVRLDGGNAEREWGWRTDYDQERIVDDLIAEVRAAQD